MGLKGTQWDWMGFSGIKMEFCGIGGSLMGLDSVVLDGIQWDCTGLGGIGWEFVRFCGIRLNLV